MVSMRLARAKPVSPPMAKNNPVAPETDPTEALSSSVAAARMTEAL